MIDAVAFEFGEIDAVEHPQCEQILKRLRRRGQRMHEEPAIIRAQRLEPQRLYVGEIVQREAAVVALRLGHHRPAERAAVEITRPFARNRLEGARERRLAQHLTDGGDRKSTRLNSSHSSISYAVFCL